METGNGVATEVRGGGRGGSSEGGMNGKEGDLILGAEGSRQWADDVLLNCTLESVRFYSPKSPQSIQ